MPSRKIPTEKKKALQNEIEEHLKAMARQVIYLELWFTTVST